MQIWASFSYCRFAEFFSFFTHSPVSKAANLLALQLSIIWFVNATFASYPEEFVFWLGYALAYLMLHHGGWHGMTISKWFVARFHVIFIPFVKKVFNWLGLSKDSTFHSSFGYRQFVLSHRIKMVMSWWWWHMAEQRRDSDEERGSSSFRW